MDVTLKLFILFHKSNALYEILFKQDSITYPLILTKADKKIDSYVINDLAVIRWHGVKESAEKSLTENFNEHRTDVRNVESNEQKGKLK